MLRSCLVGSLLALGCMAQVGSTISVPSDAAQTCSDHCRSIGMRLSAVAIMANNVGCVCQLPPTPAAGNAPASAQASAESATAAAGMATIMLQDAQRQNQYSPPPRPFYR